MNDVIELLRRTRVVVSPETYFVVGLKDADWKRLLESPELSPRMTSPFLLFKDRWEVTMVLDEVDYATCRHAIREAKVEGGFRLLSFDVELPFNVIGFLARITGILAEAEVPVLSVSSFSRDHLFIHQNDLPKALKALGEHVEELC